MIIIENHLLNAKFTIIADFSYFIHLCNFNSRRIPSNLPAQYTMGFVVKAIIAYRLWEMQGCVGLVAFCLINIDKVGLYRILPYYCECNKCNRSIAT